MNSRQPSKEHTPVTSRNNSIIGSIPVIPKKVVEVVQLDVIESYGPSAKTASQTVTTTLFVINCSAAFCTIQVSFNVRIGNQDHSDIPSNIRHPWIYMPCGCFRIDNP